MCKKTDSLTVVKDSVNTSTDTAKILKNVEKVEDNGGGTKTTKVVEDAVKQKLQKTEDASDKVEKSSADTKTQEQPNEDDKGKDLTRLPKQLKKLTPNNPSSENGKNNTLKQNKPEVTPQK